jgi:hypothetical protein
MSPKCIQAVQAAANGKPVSAAKLAQIDDAINSKMTELARRDGPRWHGLTRDQRMIEAATAAMQDVQAQAALKEHRANLQVLKAVETDTRIQSLKAENAKLTRSQSQIKDLQNTENYAAGVVKEATANLGAMMDAAESRDGTGVMRGLGMKLFGLDNPAMTADVVREVFAKADGHTGNKAAQAGARAWLDTIEGLRTRFNAAGGDIGKLGYGYLSQAHDAAKVAATKADVWAKYIMDNQLLDRKQYVHPDGALLNDAEVTAMLMASHDTLATGGANKTEPGQFSGTGARANRGSDSRVIHFKDGDAWIKYMGEYGEGSLYDSMIGHVGKMSRDIALVERMGPNPEATFKVQADISARADMPLGQSLKEYKDSRSMGSKPESYWRLVKGEAGTPENRFIAQAFRNARNIQTAAKITWGPFSALADVATVLQTLHYHRIPAIEYLSAYKKQFSGDHVDFLATQEVISESMLSSMNRWAGDNMTHSLTGRVTDAVMHLSLMNAWTDAARNAFSDTLMRSYTKKLGKSWQQLDEWDRYLMGNKGITEADWAIITKATPDPLSPVALVSAPRIRSVSDADVMASRPMDIIAIKARTQIATAELEAKNAMESGWINGRIEKFDEARDALNQQVKANLQKNLSKNEKNTEPLLQSMALLDARRELAKHQADMEAQFNKLHTQQEARDFLNAVEDGTSADLTDVKKMKPELRAGLNSAETIGRRYGEQKGKLQRQMVELENKISAMDREAYSQANTEGKAAQKKAEAMGAELNDFIKRSQDRQQARQFVIDRLARDEAPRIQAESKRMRDEAATKWSGFVSDEAQFAVVNPDLASRSITTGGGMRPGTPSGEVWRSVMQFKAFPIAMFTRHYGRIFNTPQGLEGAPAGFAGESAGGRAINTTAAIAGLVFATTIMGAIQTEARALGTGKDPITADPTDEKGRKFWAKAFAAGGGGTFLADVLLASAEDPSRQMSGHLGLLGPLAGVAGGVVDVAKSKHPGAEAVKLVSDQLPGVDMWQFRAAYEHWFLHNAQEALNPGYLARMRARAQKDWGQDYWWSPGETAPDRAPDLSKIGAR